jgi:hypothetical protein
MPGDAWEAHGRPQMQVRRVHSYQALLLQCKECRQDHELTMLQLHPRVGTADEQSRT